MTALKNTGEIALIRRLKRLVPGRADVVTGIGDDCAVVRSGRRDDYDLLLKSDPVIEGVHFAASDPAGAVGHKALARVLSDLAAMGGEPLWVLVDLVAPASLGLARVEGLYRGMARLARRQGIAIVGGDTAQGTTLELHVFAVGRVPRGTAVLRSGARRGDALYVTGTLGGSRAGRHLRFDPRLAEGRWLREQGWVTAMLDISDGLATDVRRLAGASGLGAVLEAAHIPLSAPARKRRDSLTPLEHALTDGEDFELLFTVPRLKMRAFEAAWRRRFRLKCTRIGEMIPGRGRIDMREAGTRFPVTLRGYEHFE